MPDPRKGQWLVSFAFFSFLITLSYQIEVAPRLFLFFEENATTMFLLDAPHLLKFDILHT